ncbi:hypothetical protein V6Z12_D09G238000 [Gossypium hirsutum]
MQNYLKIQRLFLSISTSPSNHPIQLLSNSGNNFYNLLFFLEFRLISKFLFLKIMEMKPYEEKEKQLTVQAKIRGGKKRLRRRDLSFSLKTGNLQNIEEIID